MTESRSGGRDSTTKSCGMPPECSSFFPLVRRARSIAPSASTIFPLLSFFGEKEEERALSETKNTRYSLLATMSNSEPGAAAAPAAAAVPATAEQLDLVREAMKAKPLIGPSSSSSSSRVHKDESVYSFDTPFSPGGLYVNLSTWQVKIETGFPRSKEGARERDEDRVMGIDRSMFEEEKKP